MLRRPTGVGWSAWLGINVNIKLKSRNRTLKIEWHNHAQALPTGLHLLPTVRVNNWMPRYPFYHVSFVWLCWTCDVWWLNYA